MRSKMTKKPPCSECKRWFGSTRPGSIYLCEVPYRRPRIDPISGEVTAYHLEDCTRMRRLFCRFEAKGVNDFSLWEHEYSLWEHEYQNRNN